MTHQSNAPWTGHGCLYKRCPSGGEISAMLHLFFFCWEMAEKKKEGSSQKNLKFCFFFSSFFSSFFSNPSVNVSASSWYAPRWKVEAIPLKSSSSQNYHFISTPARKRRAGPLLTALGISLFIVCKLWRNIVAWENVLCGWWKWAVGAATKGEIRPIFSVGGTHKSENNAHYYRKTTWDFFSRNFLTAEEPRFSFFFFTTEANQPTSWSYLGNCVLIFPALLISELSVLNRQLSALELTAFSIMGTLSCRVVLFSWLYLPLLLGTYHYLSHIHYSVRSSRKPTCFSQSFQSNLHYLHHLLHIFFSLLFCGLSLMLHDIRCSCCIYKNPKQKHLFAKYVWHKRNLPRWVVHTWHWTKENHLQLIYQYHIE